jgi:ribonuclease BN (tRNA processing enzyme)
MELTFLGTGNAFAPTRYWSSFLVDDRFLFDAPPTLLPHMNRLGKDIRDIEVIFISHFHGDHYFGLPFLLLDYAERAHRTKPLTIVGPPGIQKRVESSTNLAFANVYRKQSRGYDLTFTEVKDRRAGVAGGLDYTAFKVQHVPDLDSFAYRVRIGDKTLAYTGDSALCDALVPLARDADVLVAECSCWTETCGPIHLTPTNILALHKQLAPRTQFILTHIGAGEAPASITNANILIADDLQTIRV